MTQAKQIVKITINASYSDCIESIIYHKEAKLPTYMLTKEVDYNRDEISKEELAEQLKNCLDFFIKDDYVTLIINRTEAEKEKWLEDQKKSLNYCIFRLKKWYLASERATNQIEVYLKHKKLDWILEELKK